MDPVIAIEPRADGAILPVRAQPGAKKAGLRGEQDGRQPPSAGLNSGNWGFMV